jgi:hypothetical protein
LHATRTRRLSVGHAGNRAVDGRRYATGTAARPTLHVLPRDASNPNRLTSPSASSSGRGPHRY